MSKNTQNHRWALADYSKGTEMRTFRTREEARTARRNAKAKQPSAPVAIWDRLFREYTR